MYRREALELILRWRVQVFNEGASAAGDGEGHTGYFSKLAPAKLHSSRMLNL